MNEKQKKAIRDFVDYIVTPIAIALLVIFVVFAANKALGMGVFERYGIAATSDDITEAVDPIARQVASNETAIASHSSQLSQLSQSLDGKLDKSGNQTLDGTLTADSFIAESDGPFVKLGITEQKAYIDFDPTGGAGAGRIFIPYVDDGLGNTLALLSDIYAAVQQIAPAWVSDSDYYAKALVSYNGVVYRCKANTVSPHTTTPNADTAHWEAKPVSDLFLPLAGGTLTGPLVVGSIESNVYVGQMDSGAELTIGHLRHAPQLLRINCYGAIHIVDSNTGSSEFIVQIPYKSGTLALTSDIPDVSGYAAKAPNPTAGNLAALDAQGNPTDSGIPKSDVITTSSAAWIDITNRLHQLEMQM